MSARSTMQQVMDKLRPQIARFPGFQVFMRIPPTINIGTRGSRAAYELTILSPDTDGAGARIATGCRPRSSKERDLVVDVNTDLQIKSPRVNVEVDRDRAASLGSGRHPDRERALQRLRAEMEHHHLFAPPISTKCWWRSSRNIRHISDYLSKIYFKATAGALIPLNEVVKLKEDAMPQSINHTSVLPSVTISFNLKPGSPWARPWTGWAQVAARTLPDTMQVSFTGTAQVFQASLKNLTLLLIVAIGVVYIVLGVLYESYIHPITILSGLPSAGVGALLTLISVQVRAEYLLVRRAGHAGRHREEERHHADRFRARSRAQARTRRPAEAIYEGCLIRFRPDHDDHHGGAAGRGPMALGYGVGRRSAASARPGGGGRTDVFAVDDACI